MVSNAISLAQEIINQNRAGENKRPDNIALQEAAPAADSECASFW
jgi:hypothetical protein